MKKSPIFRPVFLSCLIIVFLFCNLVGCELKEEKMRIALSPNTKDFMEGSTVRFLSSGPLPDDYRQAITDFSFALLREGRKGEENLLLSPFSAYLALSMVAGGASEGAQEAFDQLLGLTAPRRDLAAASLLAGMSGTSLSVASSLWIKDQAELSKAFLEANRNYYGADIYGAPFDMTTVEDVNAWVSHQTNGMIERIREAFSPDELLLLLNAVSFEDEWSNPFDPAENRILPFFGTLGEETGEFLSSRESLLLEDPSSKGVLKPYQSGRYAFFALMPKEGLSLEALLAEMKGSAFLSLIKNPENRELRIELPKIKAKSDLDLKAPLSAMGLSPLFSGGLTGIVPGEALAVSSVQHKTYFELSETGTKAAAVTGIGVRMTSLAPQEPLETLCFDRPFLYGIVDLESGIPVFVGTCCQLG